MATEIDSESAAGDIGGAAEKSSAEQTRIFASAQKGYWRIDPSQYASNAAGAAKDGIAYGPPAPSHWCSGK